ncbi:DNA-processing protein DprA [Bacillus thermotolerans]|nr:DNA-processing protein DprA [Bacillus thermotolerans]
MTAKLIHLQHCQHVSWKMIYLLLKQERDLSSLYNYSSSDLSTLLSISSARSLSIIRQLHEVPIYSLLQQYQQQDIRFIPIYHSEYPHCLKNLPQPPWGLYVMGKKGMLADVSMSLAIVGARQADRYAYQSIQLLMSGLVKSGLLIVSGLAKGADTFAHEEALRAGGKTAAVIAGGFYHLYPKENKTLAKRILSNGLLISEYPPVTKPAKWQFPARNRLISGLSLGTLVVQAGRKSGSLITAYCALEQGKEVFCIPGRITDHLSDGTNDLISDGAKLVRSSEDILAEIIRK